MKKERKKGRLKAWFEDLKKQLATVEQCFRENKKVTLYYSVLIALLAILYFIGGVGLFWFFG